MRDSAGTTASCKGIRTHPQKINGHELHLLNIHFTLTWLLSF